MNIFSRAVKIGFKEIVDFPGNPSKVVSRRNNNVCDGCPIFKDGFRRFGMCGHLDCWNEYKQEQEMKE